MSSNNQDVFKNGNLSVEDFMTWPPPDVDPWRRLSSLEHECLMVVEFSEIVGPRPILVIPQNPGPHFDPGDLAVWLMTADYQLNSSSAGPVSSSKDIQMSSYNEEQGVHTYAHHFTLHDIEARGFVRPFCVAFLTKEPGYISAVFPTLRERLHKQVETLKQCNRRVFLKQLSQAVDTLGSVESQAISSYYELYYDNNRPIQDPTKTEELNVRTRKIGRDLTSSYKSLSGELNGSEQCVGPHSAEIDAWLSRTVSQVPSTADALRPLVLLAPCAFNNFEQSLRHLWTKLRRQTPALRHILEDIQGYQVNLDGYPLINIPNGNSGQSKAEEEECMSAFREPSPSFSSPKLSPDADRILVSLLPSLPQILFPVLSGQFLLVCGSEQRSATAQSLIQKLRKFLPTTEQASSSLYRTWHEGRVPATAFADYRIFGLSLPQHSKLEEFVGQNVIPFISVVDLNTDSLRSSRFRGGVLENVSAKGKLFPSDKALVPYIYSLLGHYALSAYILYYAVYCSPQVYRKNSKHLSHFAAKLALQPGDLRIVRYLVEILKTQQIDSTRIEGGFESLFLEHEPSVTFKL